ncbi:MAG: ATP-dependent Clp protease ATP-binding subunit [Anaerolineaceae bacterium]|nr:ATP-dependent Clp protease ATP-binding subunit [Anaerolineaceae bacterium]
MTPSPDVPEREIRRRCASTISRADEEARRLKHNYIGVEHIFVALTRVEGNPTATLLRRAGMNPKQVRNEIRREIGTGDNPLPDTLPLTPRCEMVLALAIFLADQEAEKDDFFKDDEEVTENQLLIATLQEGESVPVRKLVELGFDINMWLQKLLLELHAEQEEDSSSEEIPRFTFRPRPYDSDPFGFDAGLDSSSDDGQEPVFGKEARFPTPLLDKYGRDLTRQASEGRISPAISREREIRALARTLARSKKNNPLLLGDAGVGKTAVVEGLAYAIHDGSAPKSLHHRRIVQIEIGTLVAGTSLRGQFEERLIGIVDEAKNAGNVILFIDEIHTIVGAGDTIDSNLDAANILKPALARGEIMCIGATTHEEYRRAIAQDPALDRRFRTIDIEEPSPEDSLAILTGQQERLEEHHGVSIRPETLEAAVRLSVRYLPDRRLPDKALDLLDEACTRVIITSIAPDESIDGTPEVRVENIAAVLSDWSGIPVTELTQDEKRRLAGIEESLSQRVVGQTAAVHIVADAIKTARAGLGNPNRPVGVFLFLGPSGVGKTELARALAEFLFGSDEAMLRLDMSEFHDSHTVARLIGAPPGYKDTQRGGQLSDGLRRHPYSVILLDEVEKAAPEVFDIFLQVFDEGRLSDAHGRHVDARHSVFIMTSNIGTEETGKQIGFINDPEKLPDYSAHLGRFFRPEFLNRVDEVITFGSLNPDVLSKILDLQLQDLYKRLSGQGLTLQLTEEARALILKKGYDPVNGARPLRRAIERLLTRPLSTRIVEDAFQPGDTVSIQAGEGETLSFVVVKE